MGKSSCMNGTLVGTENYSSPVPWIGLYIAAASLVCMLLMIYDILLGFLNKKCWLPCKLFQLNSVTLTLVGVVVKLPVDLTTPMPSSLDQLSKLSGTTFLCIYMCYIMPSLGVMKDWTNMSALSILVITVFVNICIQLSTGVIVMFVSQHIVVLCCLLVLLLLLWEFAPDAKSRNQNLIEKCRSYFVSGSRGETSFLQRLKITYLHSFSCSPQFLSYKFEECHAAEVLGLACSAGLIWALFQSVVLKKEELCKEASDYHWSMGFIVITQILGVMTGCFVCFFRIMTMFGIVRKTPFHVSPTDEPYENNPIWYGENICGILQSVIAIAIWFILSCAMLVPLIIIHGLFYCMIWCFLDDEKYKKAVLGFEDLIYDGDMGFDQWTLRKCVEEMKRTTIARANDDHMFPSTESPLSSILLSHKAHCTGNTYERPRPRDHLNQDEVHRIPLRLLPQVLLVRISEVSLPSDFSHYIVPAFKDVFEILYFTEKYNSTTIFEVLKETEMAKAVWIARDFQHLVPEAFDKLYFSNLDRANAIMTELHNKMPLDTVGIEVCFLIDFIKGRNCSSVEILCDFIQDLLVDSLEGMLAQLPQSIFNALCGSPAEEFEERLTLGLKYLNKFETWDGLIWEPPTGCNILSLLPTEIQAEETDASNVVPQVGVQPTPGPEHEIVEIE